MGSDKQFVIALNTKDGKTAWQTPRHSGAAKKFSFGTPTVIESAGKKQSSAKGSDVIAGYDAKTGKEIWHSKFNGYSLIPKPVVGNGMVYFSTGYDSPSFLAVKLGGKGDVTRSHAGWKVGKVAPHTPSPLLVGDELYLDFRSRHYVVPGRQDRREDLGGTHEGEILRFADLRGR